MTDDATTIQAIETYYRGHRFRSRLEARWAVFFDASGIKWTYENEGFKINGRGYLPDFWLPDLAAFVETKANVEACKQAEPLLRELVRASGHPALLIADTPSIHEPPIMILLQKQEDDGKPLSIHSSWQQCPYCDRVQPSGIECSCIPSSIEVLESPSTSSPRVEHAMEQAQSARFEHGEDGRPESYITRFSSTIEYVYVAGAVLGERLCEYGVIDENGRRTETSLEPFLLPWRGDIFGTHQFEPSDPEFAEISSIRRGYFEYAGPTITVSHGVAYEALASKCMNEVMHSDSMFVWIDRPDTVGTMAEIGAAYAWNKPIFVAFASDELRNQFYFAKQLATVAIIAPDAVTAWEFFTRWRKFARAS